MPDIDDLQLRRVLDDYARSGDGTLVIDVPERPGRSFELRVVDLVPSSMYEIGTGVRDPRLQLSWELPHDGASKLHCTLHRGPLEWHLTDRSTNGTVVASRSGGSRTIHDAMVPLQHGDAVIVGRTCIWFAFEPASVPTKGIGRPTVDLHGKHPRDESILAQLTVDQIRILEAAVHAESIYDRTPSHREVNECYQAAGGPSVKRLDNLLSPIHEILQGPGSGQRLGESLQIWKAVRLRQARMIHARLMTGFDR